MIARLATGLAVAAVALPAPRAGAASIYVNSSLVVIDSIAGTAANATYRLSDGGFDLSLDNGASPATPADRIALNLGTAATLSGAVFDFTLEHRVGQGLIFRLEGTSPAGGAVAWGNFAIIPGGGVFLETLNGQGPPTSYNSLWLEARGTEPGSSFRVEDLAFSGAGLTIVDGAFVEGSAAPGVGAPPGYVRNRVYADVNLADVDWTLTGRVVGVRGTGGGDDEVRFNVALQRVEATVGVTPIPEPSTIALVGIGATMLGGAGLRGRGRRRPR